MWIEKQKVKWISVFLLGILFGFMSFYGHIRPIIADRDNNERLLELRWEEYSNEADKAAFFEHAYEWNRRVIQAWLAISGNCSLVKNSSDEGWVHSNHPLKNAIYRGEALYYQCDGWTNFSKFLERGKMWSPVQYVDYKAIQIDFLNVTVEPR